MRSALVIMFLFPSVAMADGYCFVCPKVAQPQVHIKNSVAVKNQHMRLLPLEEPQNNQQLDLALQRQYEIITSAINVADRIDQTNLFRRHRFQQNVANYNSSPVARREAVRYRSRTKVYTGYLKQSFSVNSEGHINYDLSQRQQPQQQYQQQSYGY